MREYSKTENREEKPRFVFETFRTNDERRLFDDAATGKLSHERGREDIYLTKGRKQKKKTERKREKDEMRAIESE